MPAVVTRKRRETNICGIPGRWNKHTKRIAPWSVGIKTYRSRIYHTGLRFACRACVSRTLDNNAWHNAPSRVDFFPPPGWQVTVKQREHPSTLRETDARNRGALIGSRRSWKFICPEVEHVHPRRARERKKEASPFPLILFTNPCLRPAPHVPT